jgi:hypothetical protein
MRNPAWVGPIVIHAVSAKRWPALLSNQYQGVKTDLHGKSFKVLKADPFSLWLIYYSYLYSAWCLSTTGVSMRLPSEAPLA